MVVGLLIAAAIVVVGYRTVRRVGQRLLDAVDPAIVDRIAVVVGAVDGVVTVTEVRARWAGHSLLAQVRLQRRWEARLRFPSSWAPFGKSFFWRSGPRNSLEESRISGRWGTGSRQARIPSSAGWAGAGAGSDLRSGGAQGVGGLA